MKPENRVSPCEQFAELEEFEDTQIDCIVCERLEKIAPPHRSPQAKRQQSAPTAPEPILNDPDRHVERLENRVLTRSTMRGLPKLRVDKRVRVPVIPASGEAVTSYSAHPGV